MLIEGPLLLLVSGQAFVINTMMCSPVNAASAVTVATMAAAGAALQAMMDFHMLNLVVCNFLI